MVVLALGLRDFRQRAEATARSIWLQGPCDPKTLGTAAWAQCGPHENPEQSATNLRDCLWVAGLQRSQAEELANGHFAVANAFIAGHKGDSAAAMAALDRIARQANEKWLGHPHLDEVLEGAQLYNVLQVARMTGGSAVVENRARKNRLLRQALERDGDTGVGRLDEEAEKAQRESDLRALGEAFRQAESEGFRFGEPMGSHEAHLMRRADNPLFPLNRRVVSREEVIAAQTEDRRELEEISGKLNTILDRATSLPATTDWDVLNRLREEIDALYARAVQAGESGAQIAADLWTLHESWNQVSTARAATETSKPLRRLNKQGIYQTTSVRSSSQSRFLLN